MKNLKSFEKFKYELSVGDYVLFEMLNRNSGVYEHVIGVIVEMCNSNVPYLIKTIDNIFWRSDDSISRIATPEEIKEYKIKENIL
jgi:hypothetical protein